MSGIVPYSFSKDAVQAALAFFRRNCHILLRPNYVPIEPALGLLESLMELTFTANPNATFKFEFGLRGTARLIGPVELEKLLKLSLVPNPPDKFWRGIEIKESAIEEWNLILLKIKAD
ncbi:MAG TPA: hypothetical protein VFT87_04945 [Candidatus Saccharimonadales bacterium]|nr:hypothetical protein [Candidatus Saccharimonadales bacterium]